MNLVLQVQSRMSGAADKLRLAFRPRREPPELSAAERAAAEQKPEPTPGALSAIDMAWYGRMIGLPDASRARAQSAYTIASAAAAVLLGGALLTRVDNQPFWVRCVGMVGIGMWLLACATYVWTVASPLFRSFGDIDSNKVFVVAAAKSSRTEREQVDARGWVANKIALVAAGLTLLALLGAIFHGPAEQRVSIILTPAEQHVVATACGNTLTEIDGAVEVPTLTNTQIAVKPSNCGAVSKLLVPAAGVAVIRLDR